MKLFFLILILKFCLILYLLNLFLWNCFKINYFLFYIQLVKVKKFSHLPDKKKNLNFEK
jgi:hypothetical protein